MLEREISDLNLKYRRLQTNSHQDKTGAELKQVMQALEERSKNLFTNKKER